MNLSNFFPHFYEVVLPYLNPDELPPFLKTLFGLTQLLMDGVRVWGQAIITTPVNIPFVGEVSVFSILLGSGLIVYTTYTIVKWLVP